MSVSLAIVGSRNFTDKNIFNEVINEFVIRNGKPDFVVSGGAKGADTLGENWAKHNSIKRKIFEPEWRDEDGKYDRLAGFKRNTDIVNACTHMIAFPSRKGSGTQDSIKKAKKMIGDDHVIVVWI